MSKPWKNIFGSKIGLICIFVLKKPLFPFILGLFWPFSWHFFKKIMAVKFPDSESRTNLLVSCLIFVTYPSNNNVRNAKNMGKNIYGCKCFCATSLTTRFSSWLEVDIDQLCIFLHVYLVLIDFLSCSSFVLVNIKIKSHFIPDFILVPTLCCHPVEERRKREDPKCKICSFLVDLWHKSWEQEKARKKKKKNPSTRARFHQLNSWLLELTWQKMAPIFGLSNLPFLIYTGYFLNSSSKKFPPVAAKEIWSFFAPWISLLRPKIERTPRALECLQLSGVFTNAKDYQRLRTTEEEEEQNPPSEK